MISVGAPRRPFPLYAHGSGRYLVTAYGEPFFVNGDTAWSLIPGLSLADARTYLDDCLARGFNTLICNLIDNEFLSSPPANHAGHLPFVSTAFQSALNAPYFDHAERVVEEARRRGIVLILNPHYIGFDNDEGFGAELAAASQAQVESAHTDIGRIFASHDNILWADFGDRTPTSTLLDRVNQSRTALLAADTRHTLIGHHFVTNTSGHQGGVGGYTYNWIYQYGGFTHVPTLDAYADDPTVPILMCEGWYEGEQDPVADAADVRRQAWGALLSGACGHVCGHRNIWAFGNNSIYAETDTWQNTIANVGSVADGRTHMAHVLAFFEPREWHKLVPDTGDAFVTSARGTGASFLAAAVASDNSWGAVFFPDGSGHGEVDVTLPASGSLDWYNPRTGATTAIGSGLSGTQGVTASDANDWVLLYEAA